LRPGRLDKSVKCDLPGEQDRLEVSTWLTNHNNEFFAHSGNFLIQIMHSLSRSLLLDSNVDLYQISQETNGFTGADLQGLIYSAHLEAIHEALSLSESMNGTVSKSLPESIRFAIIQETLSKLYSSASWMIRVGIYPFKHKTEVFK
jgi:peroxin-1